MNKKELEKLESIQRLMLQTHKRIVGEYEVSLDKTIEQLATLDEVKVREPKLFDVWAQGSNIWVTTDTTDHNDLMNYKYLYNIDDVLAQGDHVIGFTREELRHILKNNVLERVPWPIKAKVEASLEAHSE